MSKRPNILILCTDQQRWDTLGATGNHLVTTPDIDALYSGGAAVPHTYCQSPVCTPSRASFLTGRYPRTTRTRQNGQDIPADERLLSRILVDAGYTCGLAGKLHLSACHPSVSPITERRIDDGFHTFHWSHHPAYAAGESVGGGFEKLPNWPLNEYNLWLQNRGARYETRPVAGCEHIAYGPAAEDHQTTWCAEKTIDFVKAHSGSDQPWMFLTNFFDPHHPFDPPRAYLDRYLDRLDDIPVPAFTEGELADKPPYQGKDHRGAYAGLAGLPFDQMTATDHKMLRAAYYAMCDLVSDQVGRIIRALEDSGQREDTLVVFMSDHGELLGDHGIYLKGPFFYESAIRVPLVFNWPGTIQPQTVDGLVELTDLVPTLLDAAGVPPEPGVQGVSIWPSLKAGDGESTRETVYCEYYHAMPWHADLGPTQLTMVRDDRYKLVVDHGNDGGELYDLRDDPGEVRNLWDDPDSRDVKLRMMMALCDRMAFTADPLPARRAAW